ncbi:MAG: FAD-binding oxidoreductase [Pseudomonadota bacterium]
MRNLLYSNEKRGEWPDSWYVASAGPAPNRPALETGVTAEVCVIGAGYTGLSTALHLAERGVDVVVLEAQRAGWGASGRNGGQIGVGQRVEQPYVEKMVDAETAQGAWEIGRDAAALVKDLVARHGIDCALKDGLMYVSHRRRYDALTRDYVDHMARHYGADFVFLTPEEVAERLGAADVYGGVFKPSGGHLHPLNYARGLARAAEAAGARLFELSEATAIEGAPGALTVRTAQGSVKAGSVVVACNGYLGGLLPEAAARVMPINNFVCATEPLSDNRAKTLIRDDVAVADSRFVVNYYRLSEDRRLLFGGGESYGWRFPKDLKAFLRPKMLKVFPQLSDVAITHAWGGTLAITTSRLPVWGELRPGVFNASGYSGSGVALATMAGLVLAEALTGNRRRLDVMSRLPAAKFPGGDLMRRPTLVAAMLWAQALDAL